MLEGDRLGQLIVEKIAYPKVEEVEVSKYKIFADFKRSKFSLLRSLQVTPRGCCGFGSTGME